MTTAILPLGPVFVDVLGCTLTPRERMRLLHPQVGGVILFARNYQDRAQLSALTHEIHALRQPRLIIAVDHEGGRVQRFRDGFTRLPPMAEFGRLWDHNPVQGRHWAELAGWVMASELRACGVDLNFAPVLDLDLGVASVIGNRAFHRNPHAVADLACAMMHGMRRAGMHAVGKHFPGHGGVVVDSHVATPVDTRSWQALADDFIPFRRLIHDGLAAIMPAHVIYPAVDSLPTGFSPHWLQTVLRQQWHFQGAIISDALDMGGAATAGNSLTERAVAALKAGCDAVLACNRPEEADALLATLTWPISPVTLARLGPMHGEPHPASWAKLMQNSAYTMAAERIGRLGETDDLLDWGPDVGEASLHG